ncbi:MAG: molybdopterin-dependent oxidoreductase [Actinobacteria bacterium]|nr:molybdopterin-dependent oxidoreductase [Actinomycetota bacterium]
MSDGAPVEITVNGSTVAARPGELLIDACERTGTYIPRFCHHPRMEPVGMCRMCLVEVDTGRGPALQPSCMLTCSPGMQVDTESERTRSAQDGVLELLLVNHPLDCPVCDKGGECPLQDQTMTFGPGESRYVEEKRHFVKPIPVNTNVLLDRERCVLCDRCTRFADQVAGDRLIHFLERGSRTQVNTFPGEPFSSYFSGNTVQICPVGALTAVPFRFKARPWDLEEVESTSVLDSVGSRISVQSSRGRVLRFMGLDSDAVNWGWLSDRERFVFEAYDHPDRLTGPLLSGGAAGGQDPKGSTQVSATWADALGATAEALSGTDPDRIAVLGGSRLTNESQYAWAKLAKGILGTDNVDAQLGDGLPVEVLLGLPRATIDEACTPGGTIVLLGPDPKEELGSLYLRLRHAVVHDGATLIELTPHATGLTGIATHSIRVLPGEAAGVVRSMFQGGTGDVAAAGAVISSGGPVTVLWGRTSLAETDGLVVDAAMALLEHVPDVGFLSLLRRGNVHGALDMGMSPGFLPGRTTLEASGDKFENVWSCLPGETGLGCVAALEAAAAGDIDVLVLLGADILADLPDHDLARRALEQAGTVVAVDLFVTSTVECADIVLAAAAPTEVDGSFTNLEGRISVVARGSSPPGTSRPDWMIAVELAERLGTDLGFTSLDGIWSELASVSAVHADLSLNLIRASGTEGLLAKGQMPLAMPPVTEVPDATESTLRLVVTRSMFDNGVLNAHSNALAGLAPGAGIRVEPSDLDRLGLEDGSTVEISGPRGEHIAEVVASTQVMAGTAHVLFNQDGLDAGRLIDASMPVIDVRLVKAR